MEKMNIMTREEFKHFETIDAMYDMYLSVVTGFNRLVDICNDSSERIAELVIERDNLSKGVQKLIWEKDDLIEKHNVYTSALNADIAAKAAKIELMQKELDGRKAGYVALKTQMDSSLAKKDEEIEKLKKELDETYKAWNTDSENHSKRDMTLVDEIAKKNRDIEYYKDQERIRTDQLRATESKVEELYGSINRLTLNCRSKNTEIARLAKENADIRHEHAKIAAELEFNKEDDHGKSGFKRYIEHLIEEEERAVPERFKERLNQEITAIFTKEEETEVKSNVRCRKPDTYYCSYSYECCRKPENFNCDFKDDIPCGEDAIE